MTKGKRLSGVEPVGYLKYLSATSRARDEEAWVKPSTRIDEVVYTGIANDVGS